MSYEPCQNCHTSIFIKLVKGQKRKSILKNPIWFLLITNQRPFTQKSNTFQCRSGESFYIFPCLWRTSSPVYMSWTQTSHTGARTCPNLNKVHFCRLSCLPPYSCICTAAVSPLYCIPSSVQSLGDIKKLGSICMKSRYFRLCQKCLQELYLFSKMCAQLGELWEIPSRFKYVKIHLIYI
jgi:hypothetical protein